MIIRPHDLPSVQKSFQEIRASLMGMTPRLAQAGGADGGDLLKEISRITQTLVGLEQSVGDLLKKGDTKLGALMGVGRSINSTLGLQRVLEEVMDSLIELMRAERGFLMLKTPDGQLKIRVGRGLAHTNLSENSPEFSWTMLNHVANSGEAVLTTNAQEDPRFDKQESVAAYQLRSVLCAPLKLKDIVIGVMYVDNRAHAGRFQSRDRELITAFADQAAVAIDNARLFDSLQDKNRELEEAYQATLEGWVSALDMRDKETEGHTQRVTVITQRLARKLGVGDEDMIHITRGALLHDIGKMAIPDGILLKPGKLTDMERKLIEMHPIYAYEMLKTIDFLKSAIDIPWCHHEKWDGTGYPRKLKGEEIPFAARIFPLADVWDALTSNRPYREGMPHDQVREIIRKDIGTHFDPMVAEAFLDMEDLSV